MLKGEDKERTNTSPAIEAVDGGSSRKAYQSPEIRVYGNIKNLTQAVLQMGSVFDDASQTAHFKSL